MRQQLRRRGGSRSPEAPLRHTLTVVAFGALTQLAATGALAATLTWLGVPAPVSASFWDPAAWDPVATPAAGDDLFFQDDSGSPPLLRFLGTYDLLGGAFIPAQNVSVGAVTVSRGDFTIDWGGNGFFSGDPAFAGGLSATSLDVGDVLTGLDPSQLTLINPQLAVSGVVRVGNTFGGMSTLSVLNVGNGLLGPSSFSASSILLAGRGARFIADTFDDDIAVTADSLQAAFADGAGLTLRSTALPFSTPTVTLTLGELLLDRVPGTSLDLSGRVEANTHDFVAIADGGALGSTRLAIGRDSRLHVDPSYGPPTPSAALARLEAYEGATLTLDIDAGAADFGGNNVNTSAFGGLAYGGNLAVRVTNGGRLFIRATPFSALGIPSMGPVQFLAADSPTSGAGSVDLLFDGSVAIGSLNVGATGSSAAAIEFRNGGGCVFCDVLIATENVRGSFRLGDGALFDSSSLRVVNSDAVFDTGAILQSEARLIAGSAGTIALNDTARVELRSIDVVGANARIALNGAGERRTHFANVGTDFMLTTSGVRSGGDLPGLESNLLALSGGAQLRVEGSAARGTAPTLAVGDGDGVTFDAASSIFIGDAGTAAYQAGRVVLDDGGHLLGTGLINGSGGFFNPAVLNTGGNLSPGFSPGTLTIAGEYVQQSGTLTLEIGGVNAGEYDVLDAVQGASFLGGTLRFERINGFAGVLGAQLDFFAGRAVSFDPALVIEDNTGFDLAFDFATGIATITRVLAPEPPIAALLAAGCVGLGWIGRRRRAR